MINIPAFQLEEMTVATRNHHRFCHVFILLVVLVSLQHQTRCRVVVKLPYGLAPDRFLGAELDLYNPSRIRQRPNYTRWLAANHPNILFGEC